MACLILSAKLNGQDSLVANSKPKLGIEYNVNAGYFYAHSLGGSISFKDKHKLALNGMFFPNENPFKGRINYGFSGDYNFYPNKTKNRFDLLFRSTIYYSNFKNVIEYNYPQNNRHEIINQTFHIFDLFLGFGFNLKASQKINFTATISSFIIGFTRIKSLTTYYIQNTETYYKNKDFDHLFLEDFMMNDLLVKIGVNYLLK
jgi:hypothetical protein